MSITFEIPAELENSLAEENGDLSRFAKEAFLVRLYQQGKISLGKLAHLLGMGVIEADQWLGKLGIPLNYGVQQFEEDLATLRSLEQEKSAS